MPDEDFDAYAVLQVVPTADEFVLEAAYRALARHFHPDGATPDEARMAEINRAYNLVRTGERRKRYDRLHRAEPVGPGLASSVQTFGGRVPPPSNGPAGAPGDPGMMTIDFGRYEGWKLKDLVRHDPEYLMWLSRHSSGVRYRNQIMSLLGAEAASSRR